MGGCLLQIESGVVKRRKSGTDKYGFGSDYLFHIKYRTVIDCRSYFIVEPFASIRSLT